MKLLLGNQGASNYGDKTVEITNWIVSGAAMRKKIKLKNSVCLLYFPDIKRPFFQMTVFDNYNFVLFFECCKY